MNTEETEMLDKQQCDREDAALRETLGQIVRDVWRDWAMEQPNRKPSWLVPWAEMSEPDKEVGRRIGERLFREGVRTAIVAANKLITARKSDAPSDPAEN